MNHVFDTSLGAVSLGNRTIQQTSCVQQIIANTCPSYVVHSVHTKKFFVLANMCASKGKKTKRLVDVSPPWVVSLEKAEDLGSIIIFH